MVDVYTFRGSFPRVPSLTTVLYFYLDTAGKKRCLLFKPAARVQLT